MAEAKKTVKTAVKAAPKAKVEKKPASIKSEPAAKVAPVKAVKKEPVKAEAPVKVKAVKASTNAAVSVDVYGIDGKVSGKVSLPGAIFGERVNKELIAQAVRVYLANQRQGNASTKTRGEVDGSTRKIYRQKGTGRARHGGVRAPIFVKGGIVFGPKPRDYSLSLPKKMKRKALFSALSAKAKDSQVMVLSGVEKLDPKTKVFAEMLKKLGVADKKQKLLFVTTASAENVKRAGRNVPGVSFTVVNQLNTYEVLNTKNLVLLKDAVDEMEKLFLGKDK
jgi:large subunit ribosomal protein L4